MFVTTSRLACRRVLQLARGAPTFHVLRSPSTTTTLTAQAAAPRTRSLSTLTLSVAPSPSIVPKVSGWLENLSQAIWLIKRTFQPSLIRKKRKSGYLKRRQTVGGRRILKRRKAKGRARLFGA